MKARLLALAISTATLVTSAAASAGSMDPALERLTANSADHPCASPQGKALGPRCLRDDAAFLKLVNQYGFALAPNAMHSARTTGYGGFHLSLEGQYTKIDSEADYIRRGTRGPEDASTFENREPPSFLQLYSLKLRKSFGFGLEVMGTVGVMPQTSFLTGGADVRMSLLEGFRQGLAGFIPDAAVGGGVRTITGTAEFQLTVAGLDAQLSKPVPVGDSSILIPWIGYQYLWIFGDSGIIDLTPGTDPMDVCNYAGSNVPGNPDPNQPNEFDGQPVCIGGSPEDFNNNVVFSPVRLERQRLLLGLAYRYEMVMLGMEFLTDLVSPRRAQVGGGSTLVPSEYDADGNVTAYTKQSDRSILRGEDRQYALVFELGVMF